MGNIRTRSTTPDLFSTARARQSFTRSVEPPTTNEATTTVPSPRYVLPRDLTAVIKDLADLELDRLLAAALVERERRGRRPPVADETSRKRRVQGGATSLAPGKMNAVRAAHEAGVTPSQIARYFGISPSDVRRALAGDRSKA